jgi:hypothetical protein
MGNLIAWLFTDACTAGGGPPSGNANCPNPEVFHFYAPWIAFCAIGLLFAGYYEFEGRKRLVRNHMLYRALLDKFTRQIALLCFIGPFLIFARYAMDGTFFQWRIWRYLWLAWAVSIALYWLYYFIARYESHRAGYERQRTMAQYIPPPRPKRKASSRAS